MEKEITEEVVKSELDEPVWAVVNAVAVKALDVTYEEASQIVSKLNRTNGAQPCIVRTEAAKRILVRAQAEDVKSKQQSS